MPVDKEALDAEALAHRVPVTERDMIARVGMIGLNVSERGGMFIQRRIARIDTHWTDSYDTVGSSVWAPLVDVDPASSLADTFSAVVYAENHPDGDDEHVFSNMDTSQFSPDFRNPSYNTPTSAHCDVCDVDFDISYVDDAPTREFCSPSCATHRGNLLQWDLKLPKGQRAACGRCKALQGKFMWQWVARRFRMQAIADWWLKEAMRPKNVATHANEMLNDMGW